MTKLYYRYYEYSLYDECDMMKSLTGGYYCLIGSATCYDCEHNLESNITEHYIVCSLHNMKLRKEKLKKIIN